MSQALYRKYRPKTFDEVYGQDGIVNILKNQIKNNKVSHAYLFAGTRGTGKTSCAKIFSRAVNCLNPKDGNPCNECENCKRALDESTMDIVEMDAASNRRIDDIRQLRDTVIYPPTDLRYKVYIIDEAHMITNEGFNALLKIMEEPPKHLIFILATTEVDKIPDTILSRTQRFEFKKIDRTLIQERIGNILDRENINMDPEAIDSISTIGKGSMRDALSVLDQVTSIGKASFSKEDIDDILGIVAEETKISIVESALEADPKKLIETVDRELEKGKDAYNLIKEMISFYEGLMDKKIFGVKTDDQKNLEEIIERLRLEEIVNILDILLEYEDRIKKSDNRNILLKMAMVRMVDRTPRDSLSAAVKALEERVSRIETNGVYISEETKFSKKQEARNPVSIQNSNPFEDLRVSQKDKNQDQGEKKASKIEKARDPSRDQINDERVKGKKSAGDLTRADKGDKDHKAPDFKVENFVRTYMVENFPTSKKLFEEVRTFELKKDQLIYYVSSNGMNYSNIMTPLVKNAERAYQQEKSEEIHIKFELMEKRKNLNTDEQAKKEDSQLTRIKEFFGNDNVEIIN